MSIFHTNKMIFTATFKCKTVPIKKMVSNKVFITRNVFQDFWACGRSNLYVPARACLSFTIGPQVYFHNGPLSHKIWPYCHEQSIGQGLSSVRCMHAHNLSGCSLIHTSSLARLFVLPLVVHVRAIVGLSRDIPNHRKRPWVSVSIFAANNF